MRDFLLAETDVVHRGAWGALVDAIKTGQPQPSSVFGMSVFEYYTAHPEDGQQFGRAMEDVSAMSAQGVLTHYDFSNAGLIIDVGGGNGSLLRFILQHQPAAKGAVCDLPYIETQANEKIRTEGLEDRCRFHACDFFEGVLAGGDVYLLRFILHDWADSESRRILRSIRRAIAPGGRLLIVEMLLPEDNSPGFVQLMDINMLAMTGGRERSAAEYGKLCADEGFRLVRTIPTESSFWIAECEAN
jgi:SAM-dependent methyltransferase